MSNTLDKISDVIADKLGVEPSKITPEAKFVEDLGADSLDTVELIMQLEDEFNIEIPDEEAEKLTTVGSVAEYIDKNLP
ncbi:MAG: acyl carrier protein [Candidatus Neomarinimicrobiota bacterium]